MMALGIMGLTNGDFTVIWQPVSKGLPGREALVYLCALISLASRVGLLWRRTAANRFPRIGSLVSALVVVLPTVSLLTRIHGRRLLGCVPDGGDVRSGVGVVYLVCD
jgi:hypothetical protein